MFFIANTSKQIMQRTYLRKFRPHKDCKKKMREIKPGKTNKSRDDLVYTFTDGQYSLFKVEEVNGNILTCSEINFVPKIFQRHPDLMFHLVGVFQDLGKKNVMRKLNRKQIKGKLVRVRGLIITVPCSVLLEN